MANFYQKWFAAGNPSLLDVFKKKPSVGLPSAPKPVVTPTPTTVNNRYDLAGLFQQGVGRPITLPEEQDIRGQVAGLTNPSANPAQVVSEIQKAISKVPKTVNTPASLFGTNKNIVEQYQAQQQQKEAATETPAASPSSPVTTGMTTPPFVYSSGAEQEAWQKQFDINRQTAAAYLRKQNPNENYYTLGNTVIRQSDGKEMTDQYGVLLPNVTSDVPETPTPETPKFSGELSATETAQLQAERQAAIDAATKRSQEKQAGIQRLGETRKAGARSFLAGIGALGRTATGAPEGSGLGQLDAVEIQTQRAISEEQNRLAQEISDIETKATTKRQTRLDELSKLAQQDFTNRLALAQEGRLNKAEQRQLSKDLYDMAKDIPVGQVRQFGNQYVTGLKEVAPKVREFQQYDANTGQLVFGGVDEATGEPIYQYEMQIGEPKDIENWKSVVEGGRLLAFNEATGEYKDTGKTIPKQYAPSRATTGGAVSGRGETTTGDTLTDPQQIAKAIIAGRQPPVLTGLYSKSSAVRAELERKGYDLAKATEEWQAIQKFIVSSNSTQQVRMRQAETSVEQAINRLEELNKEFKRTGFTPANKAAIYAASQGVGPEKNAATEFVTQLNVITDELAVVLQGGNTPTERSMELAQGMISKNLSMEQIQKQINIVRQNLQYRKNSWATVGAITPGGENRYAPTTSTDPTASTTNDPMGIR